MNRARTPTLLCLLATVLLVSAPATASEGPASGAEADAASPDTGPAVLATELFGEAPRAATGCSAEVTCTSGSTRSCTGTTSCTVDTSGCPRSVTCDGDTTYCLPYCEVSIICAPFNQRLGCGAYSCQCFQESATSIVCGNETYTCDDCGIQRICWFGP